MNRLYILVILGLMAGGWLAACSAERHNPIARLYHNTTARYNGFFLANERLKAMEAEVAAKTVPDYNRLLPIFTVIDSTAAAGLRKELEEIIKKASYPIQKHPTSDWTDDSYLLIGKARFYGREFEDAIKTFKYVNSTSKKEETRHEALVWLMRCFVILEDLESAKAVSDIMKKQFLNKENALLLFLTRAQYHLLRQELPLTIANLKIALPLIEKKDEAARVRFILGQLYQETGQDRLAYQQFTRVLRKNPPYELGFQSKLRLSQVTELSNIADREKIDKYFRKLEKDAKNKEYLDKIYYERARVELKQNKPGTALSYLNQSVRASTGNQGQKGYSYLMAGQIYYDKYQKYRLAQAYYDSAVQVLPPTATEYVAAAERRDVLNEFANNLAIVEREDSLQALSRLDQAELDKRLDAIIAQAETRRAAEAQRLANNAPLPGNTNANFPGNAAGTNSGNEAGANNSAAGVWYFDNPVTVASARAEFMRRWGNRQLQDNWRTTNQTATNPQQDLVLNNTGTPTGGAAPTAEQTDALRAALLKDIPLTPEQKAASNEKIEEAYFALANIYRLQLKEPAQAIETYETLLKRFPRSKHTAEVYYTLYLMFREANDPKQNTYASLIKQQFPESRYAKLIDQPDYLVRVSAGNVKARQLYDSAFTLFEKENFTGASNVLNQIRREYPDTDLNDKVSFLGILIIGKTEQPVLFKMALQQFINNYPNSPLADKARMYLGSITLYESGKLSEAEFDRTHPVKPAPAEATPVRAAAARPNPAAREQTPPAAAANREQPTRPAETQPQPEKASAAAAQPQTTPATSPAPANATPAANPANGQAVAPAPAKPAFAATDLQAPHLVVIAYPKGHAAFADVVQKVQAYNSKYNAPDQLTVETATLNPTQDLVIVRQFANGQKAKVYTSKQKTPQSPLSKIRGIEFVTFVISSDNLAILQQQGQLEEYLTFYKNNY